MRRWIWAGFSCAILLAVIACASSPGQQSAAPDIRLIRHVIVVMQENRSFDSYFGTFPGADGIPADTCVPDPAQGHCVRPYHDRVWRNHGGPHGAVSAAADIDGGKMDGFVRQAEQAGPNVRENAPGLGNLVADFDFTQSPRLPLLLPVYPPGGPASHWP
jgi:phospholipase C